MDLDGLLARLIELGGSDMHLKIASPAMARVDGALTPMEERLLTESDLETVLTVVTERTPAKREHFYTAGELDTAYLAEGLVRATSDVGPSAGLAMFETLLATAAFAAIVLYVRTVRAAALTQPAAATFADPRRESGLPPAPAKPGR